MTDLYFCPAAREIEIAPGGGFTVCCDQPKLHIPVQNGPTIPEAVQTLDAAKRADFQATQRLATLEADGERMARIIDGLSKKNSHLGRRVEQAESAVARIRALHQPYRSVHDEGDDRSCAHCNLYAAAAGIIVPWPCDTIRALDGEQL